MRWLLGALVVLGLTVTAVCESVPMWGYLFVNGCHQRVCLGYTSVVRYRRVPYLVCN